jgi:hypothetical protein
MYFDIFSKVKVKFGGKYECESGADTRADMENVM